MMSGGTSLQPGDLVPHFSVTTLDGERFDYSSVWQRSNLLLVVLPDENNATSVALVDAVGELTLSGDISETVVVVTRSKVTGLPSPAVLVADRWGEIIDVAPVRDSAAAPTAAALREWLEYVSHRCPECEGEAK
jgi:hypothetical protein